MRLSENPLTADFNRTAILRHLDVLIKRQSAALRDWAQQPADNTMDWLAINYLFRIGREYPSLNATARKQLDVIFRAWTSPDPLSLQ